MTAKVTLMVITDGRQECLSRTLAALAEVVDPKVIHHRLIVNDCPDPDFTVRVDDLGFNDHVRPLGHRRGFAGAVAAGWAALPPDTDYVLHLEDDFIIARHWDVNHVTAVLAAHPHLQQMALRRQAWNAAEREAGGVVEMAPDDYTDCSQHNGHGHWLEHRKFFTTNPSIYPLSVTKRGWPVGEQSEGRFGLSLFEDPQARCGYWGKRADAPWVIHIGIERIGTGY